jgi:hypothetical protein
MVDGKESGNFSRTFSNFLWWTLIVKTVITGRFQIPQFEAQLPSVRK